METLVYRQETISVTAKVKNINQTSLWKNIEFNRFSLIVLVLGLVGCIGGVAAACAVQVHVVLLAAVVFSSMFALTMVLAVAPMRTIFMATCIALVVDVLVFSLWFLQ